SKGRLLSRHPEAPAALRGARSARLGRVRLRTAPRTAALSLAARGLLAAGQLGVGHLEARQRVADRVDLLAPALLQHGQQGGPAVDRRLALPEVALALRP